MRPVLLHDQEFGDVSIKRVPRAKYVRVRVAADGSLHATMPKIAPLFLLKNLINTSRIALRKAIKEQQIHKDRVYADSDQIGTSHVISLQYGESPKAIVRGQAIVWTVRHNDDPVNAENQDVVRSAVRKALNKQAEAYLPRRLQYLAEIGGFHYTKIRYGNAKGRWGSCTSRGVISLNVALMNLPKELIDYVLVHELAHTKYLNHSGEFWSLVGTYYPDYKQARTQLKTYSPYL